MFVTVLVLNISSQMSRDVAETTKVRRSNDGRLAGDLSHRRMSSRAWRIVSNGFLWLDKVGGRRALQQELIWLHWVTELSQETLNGRSGQFLQTCGVETATRLNVEDEFDVVVALEVHRSVARIRYKIQKKC